jgi:hypothetical protein
MDKFKVGDKIIALKDRPVEYSVTTDKVVCRVLGIIGGELLRVVLADDVDGFCYTVDQRYFKLAKSVFKGNIK